MRKFTQLGSEKLQKISMLLNSGDKVDFVFEYKESQQGWFFSFEWKDYKYKNIRLVTHYNILRAYNSYLPFGLRCDTPDMQEPTDISDFVDDYATVYLLEQNDINIIEGKYYAKVAT